MINEAAAEALKRWVEQWGRDASGAMLLDLIDAVDNWDQTIVDAAYAITQEYGNASAATAAAMYDATAEFEGKILPAAEMAETPPYWEVRKTVQGTLKSSSNIDELAGAVARLVKRTGVDTTMKNAIRDSAEWAWIPNGDTCAFCLTLASRGWQQASEKALKNGHAEHIHSNCDCTYSIRHSSDMDVAGYNPDKYLKMYYDADGVKPKDRINAMRREQYAKNKDKINAQKRAAYEQRIRIDKGIDGRGNLRYNNSPAKEGEARELPDSFLFSYKGTQGFIPAHTIIEEPLTIAGKGSSNELRDVPRLVATYKQDAEGWKKRVGKVYSDKYVFDIHWYEHSGIMYEHKIKNVKEK